MGNRRPESRNTRRWGRSWGEPRGRWGRAGAVARRPAGGGLAVEPHGIRELAWEQMAGEGALGGGVLEGEGRRRRLDGGRTAAPAGYGEAGDWGWRRGWRRADRGWRWADGDGGWRRGSCGSTPSAGDGGEMRRRPSAGGSWEIGERESGCGLGVGRAVAGR